MEISQTLYVVDRKDWRAWLRKNHNKEPDIWLIFYRKDSGKPRLPYNDAVDEALCWGWIDSTVKTWDEESFAQRFSPRRKKSVLSDMNRERVHRLMKKRLMTKAGLKALEGLFDPNEKLEPVKLKPDIEKALKEDPEVWKNYQAFPESYKRIRIGYIEHVRDRPEQFRSSLKHFIKKTKKNKKFGLVR